MPTPTLTPISRLTFGDLQPQDLLISTDGFVAELGMSHPRRTTRRNTQP